MIEPVRLGHYCRPCGENLTAEDVECPFCGQPATPLDEVWGEGPEPMRGNSLPEKGREFLCGAFVTKTRIRRAMASYGMSRGEFERAARAGGLMLLDDGSLALVSQWLKERERQ